MKSKITALFLSVFLIFGQTAPIFKALPAYALSKQSANSLTRYEEIAHKAYNQSNFLKAGQYYEKAYSIEKNKVFLDNAITAYLSYSFNLTNEQKYDEAIKYCEKVLSMRPSEKNAKELLSDIYYAKSNDSFYKGNANKAREDLEEALKYSVLPEQEKKAKEGLSQLEKTGNKIAPSEFKEANSYAPDSIPELVKLMEMKIYGKTQANLPVISRIQKLEKEVFNKSYDENSLSTRLDRLKKSILPELSQKPVNNFQEGQDYIQDIIEQSCGTAKIFGKMPILVYVDDANTKTYKGYFIDAIKNAMKEWEIASEGKIKFEFSSDPMKANMKIVWTDNFEDFAWQPELKKEDIASEKEKIKYGKASSIVQIGSIAAMVLGSLAGVPAIGTVGAIGGSVASPLLQYKSLNLDDRMMPVKINTSCTAGMTKEQSMEKIKQIAMHQFGHSLGIYGHSPNPKDIMYSNFSVNKLSERDKNTIKEIYKDVKAEIKK